MCRRALHSHLQYLGLATSGGAAVVHPCDAVWLYFPSLKEVAAKPSAAVHDLEWIHSPWIGILHHWGKAPECEFFHSHWRQPPHSQPHCSTSSGDSVQRCESWVYECYPSLEVFLLDRPINCTKPRTLNKTEQLIYNILYSSCLILSFINIYHVLSWFIGRHWLWSYIFSSASWWTLRDAGFLQLEHIKTICCIRSYNFFTLNMASDML